MYAIIQLAGHQYRVSPGDELEINNLPYKEGDKVFVKEVLLLVNNNEIKTGTPFIANTQVILTVVKKYSGEKIAITRFKAKSRYTKRKGFRPKIMKVKVDSVGNDGEIKTSKKPPAYKSTRLIKKSKKGINKLVSKSIDIK